MALFIPFARRVRPSRLSLRRGRFWASSSQAPTFEDPNPLAVQAQKILTSLKNPSSDNPEVRNALDLIRTAIAQKSPRAKTLLASMHNIGLAVPQDSVTASRLFFEAAKAGDPVAQCSLGVLQLRQIKESDEKRDDNSVMSTDFVVDVDEKGVMRGRLDLEMKDGSRVKDAPKPAELVRRVRKARRKAGFSDLEFREYEEFQERERLKKLEEDKRTALSWLERAVEQENDEAMVALANEILHAEPKRAVALYERAVKASRNIDAYFNLGQIFTNGLDGVPPDPKAALKNFAMAAQLDDPSAQFYLGHLYRVGSPEVDVDHASSRQYIEMAAEQGHAGAMYYLALMHRNGEGGLEASEGAFRRYVKAAADAGYGPAYACLGEMHYKGTDGAEVDFERALRYFTKAGKMGESDAMCSAAAMHFHGFGTEEDHHESFLLYQDAAQLGSVQALRSIGSMYYHGQGVPANRKIAEHFFNVADENEETIRKEEELHTQTPVARTPAPKHPMQDIPQFAKERDREDLLERKQVSETVKRSPTAPASD